MKKLLLGLFSLVVLGTTTMAQTVTFNANPTGTSGNIVFGTLNYHASEYIYKEAEIGASNFTVIPISQIKFSVGTVGANTTFNNVNIYMKNAAGATFTTGAYNTTGYTLVYSGSVTMNTTGFSGVTLNTPFLRIAGNNLHILITRNDNATHTGFVYVPSLDDPSGVAATNTSRRYNSATVAPVSGSTSLDASTFRAAIQLIAPLAVDATLSSITNPSLSCNATSNISVVLKNNGTTPIAIGAASVTLRLGGANSSQSVLNNTSLLAPNATETITFNNVVTGNPGTTRDSAFVTLVGDLDIANDTIKGQFLTTTTVSVSNGTPATEDVEGSLPVFSSIQSIVGGRQLWGLRSTPYTNTDMGTATLPAHGGTSFFIHDNYSGASSVGVINRLVSNCITLPATTASCASSVSFWLSHDMLFPTDLDSMYLTVSTDKGATWTRLAGYGRVDPAFTTIGWKQETVNLTAYQGQTFQLGFEAVSKYGNIIGLDDITISTNCVQPVELSSFTGVKVNGVNKLSWNTATELNNSGFELQRSADGKNFTKLAFVNSKSENGNSSSPLSYTFVDENPLRGANYYRLNQVDKDGKSTLSEIVTIKGDKVSKLEVSAIFPNPVKDRLTVKIEGSASEKVSVQVVDLAGKVLSVQNVQVGIGENQISVNTSKLTNGNYILKVTTENGETSVQKFVKQ